MPGEGMSPAGLQFPGFMYLHTLFLTRGRLESTWTALRMFGGCLGWGDPGGGGSDWGV